ncbi:MAG: SEC-C domain-containing protein, partial [Deltaproteobacteria bacterium]|nr:SEC-C domain-containing protein [Deltaproteobacteria bacterium]
IVELVEKMSDNPLSKNVIGKQIDSIVLPRDRTLVAKCGYHSNVVKMESYMPDQVLVISEKLHMNVKDISICPVDPENTPPMSGPKLRPNQPCWCSSGKKFKNCHGRPSKKRLSWGLKFKPGE